MKFRRIEQKFRWGVILLLLLSGTAAFAANPPMCPHILGWDGTIAAWCEGAPWIKVISYYHANNAMSISGAKVYYRPYDADPNYPQDGGWLRADLTGSQYADLVWAKIQLMTRQPEAVGYRNEFSYSTSTEAKRTYSEFVGYRNRLVALGYTGKIIFGSFPVGWMDAPNWDLAEIRSATDAADGVDVHEGFDLQVNCCAPWLAFRHRDIAIANHLDHLGNKDWFIGEFGTDLLCGNCTECSDSQCRTGWLDRGKLSAEQFITQLGIYRAGCADQVLAVFVWQQGASSGWDVYETEGDVSNWMKTTWPSSVGNLTGNVKNASGVNLSGATVTLSPGDASQITNASGNYTFSDIATGTYSVTTSKSGYQTQTQNNKVVSSGATTTCNFTLATAGGTMVTNGNFESGFTSGVGTGWTTWTSSWSNPITFSDCTSPVHGGSHSQRWGRSDNQRVHGGICQVVSVTPGKTYRITAYLRFTSTDSGAWLEMGYDSTGQISNGEAASVIYTKLESGGQGVWLTYTKDVTAADGTISIFAKFGQYNQGGAGPCYGYLDDVSMVEITPTTGEIAGSVVNSSGTGISTATVSTNTGGYSTGTDTSGTYVLASVVTGTYNVTAAKTGYVSQVQNGKVVTTGQTTPCHFTLNVATQAFSSVPTWASSYDAGWGGSASWSSVAGGQSGNFLQVNRNSQGSSVKTLLYTVPTNTTLTVSVYMKCPSFGGTYWMECACKLGNNTASDFDNNGGTWTMIKKFSNDTTNGNGNTWTKYSTTVSTGASTQLSVGFKLGSSGGGGPTVGWDTLAL